MAMAASAFVMMPGSSSSSNLCRRQERTMLEAKKKKVSGLENKPVRERKVAADKIELEGTVKEALPNAMFRVNVPATDSVILCTISGKIRKNFVKILVGDNVKVELSPYDLTRGRITFRERK